MIRFVKGNLLESDAQVLVNTVNTVGVMGKGIALQFKEAYPNNYILYRKACKEKKVCVGKMFVTKDASLYKGEKIIVNFPTKTTWRKPSEYSYIQDGLVDLRNQIEANHWKSIAIPPLGSHNGGLDWSVVRQMIQSALADLNCDIILYEPSDAIIEKMKAERVKLTPARAMLLYMLCKMNSEGEFASEFASEKLAYFLQKFGAEDCFRLTFKGYYYGPYSGKVKYVLHYLNGSYIKGVGDMQQKPFDYIWLVSDTRSIVEGYLSKPENTRFKRICDVTSDFLSGFYSNYLLELLSTVDFILTTNNRFSNWIKEDRIDIVKQVEISISEWNERKAQLFCDKKYIGMVVDHLKDMYSQMNCN